MKVTGIILAAGSSVRYGGINKNLEIVNKKRVLEYSLDVFSNNLSIDNIIVVTKSDDIDIINEIIKNYTKDIKIVIGGSSRKESVYNALKETNSDIVIIHDAARPLIKDEYIDKCLDAIKDFDGCTIGVKTKDTIKITDDNGVVINSTDRKNTWIIQTPQCFKKDILLKLHEKFKDIDTTDDCMLLEMDHYKVKLIDGDYQNIKITFKEDLNLIKNYLK